MDPALALLKEVLGLDLDDPRVRENLDAYRPILAEIEKLRGLDLTDVHPAIVHDPLIPYRRERRPPR